MVAIGRPRGLPSIDDASRPGTFPLGLPLNTAAPPVADDTGHSVPAAAFGVDQQNGTSRHAAQTDLHPWPRSRLCRRRDSPGMHGSEQLVGDRFRVLRRRGGRCCSGDQAIVRPLAMAMPRRRSRHARLRGDLSWSRCAGRAIANAGRALLDDPALPCTPCGRPLGLGDARVRATGRHMRSGWTTRIGDACPRLDGGGEASS